jgi:hypothetical protein
MESSVLAVFLRPPMTMASKPVAWLLLPPLMLAASALAMFSLPPLTLVLRRRPCGVGTTPRISG